LAEVWGEALPQQPAWLACVAHWLGQIQEVGTLAALNRLNAHTRA
jgi:hypothetical protein